MMRTGALLFLAAVAYAAEPVPLVVLLGNGAESWKAEAAARGWETELIAEALPNDGGVRILEAALAEARKRRDIDANRTYLAGQGPSGAVVFYAVSRRPDLWAAALSAAGSAGAAVESNRLFGANAALVPVLWTGSDSPEYRKKLTAAGFALEPRDGSLTVREAFDWLAAHKREPFPPKVDCETGNLGFARCYWASIEKFDGAQRNDVLPSSRVLPGSGAYLALGGFGYNVDAPGPGVLVSWLAPNYAGPLKLDDRIVAIGGKPLADARAYVEFMAAQKDERLTGVMVERGKQRIRLDSRIALSKREETATARFQVEFLSDTREIQIVTRGVGALRLTLPAYWTPAPINWNGGDLGKAEAAGCYLLAPGTPARKCE
jgi:hypothetical protein